MTRADDELDEMAEKLGRERCQEDPSHLVGSYWHNRHCTGCQKPPGVMATHQMGTVEHPSKGERDDQGQ